MANLWLAFVTGLTSGGVSCFAVQWGLLASSLTDKNKKNTLIIFLISKLVAYTILGALLGTLGASLFISPKIQGYLQIFVGFYMIVTALRLLDVHPLFRYFVIKSPKFILRYLRNKSQIQSFFTPIILGAFTVFIPCGVTQAMMLYAISSANIFYGAGIMFSFVLGTMPVFYLIGIAANELFKKKMFLYIAATFILIIGFFSLNSGQNLRGSAHTIQNYWSVIFPEKKQNLGNIINIQVTNSGYETDVNTLKLGVPVKIKLTTKNVRSCARAFTIPDLNYFKVLPETGVVEIEFTPTKLGRMTFTCSMGMYSGFFNVIE